VPESSQVETPEFHVWTDRAAADRDIAAALGALRAAFAVDERRIVVAGFSQGGGLAVSCALTGRVVPATGFAAFGAGVDDVDAGALEHAAAAAGRGVRGALLVGSEDEALPAARALHETLSRAGLTCTLQVVPGLVHEMPESGLIGSALRSIVGP
jgi:predicted esterase